MALPKNVVLVGFMGSGKTSTGKELAQLLGFDFVDLDHRLEEKCGMKISKIFETQGEEHFRSLEREVLGEVEGLRGAVISTGGGSWMDASNREKFEKLGLCVWLKVSPEIAWQRVSAHLSQRPLLGQSKDPFLSLVEKWRERIPEYSKAALSFETDQKKPKEVASEIFRYLTKDSSR